MFLDFYIDLFKTSLWQTHGIDNWLKPPILLKTPPGVSSWGTQALSSCMGRLLIPFEATGRFYLPLAGLFTLRFSSNHPVLLVCKQDTAQSPDSPRTSQRGLTDRELWQGSHVCWEENRLLKSARVASRFITSKLLHMLWKSYPCVSRVTRGDINTAGNRRRMCHLMMLPYLLGWWHLGMCATLIHSIGFLW